jgi:hypothetical protein
MKRKDGRKVKVATRAHDTGREQRVRPAAACPAAEEAHERDHHDERTGVVSPSARPSIIWGGDHPCAPPALQHIGQKA